MYVLPYKDLWLLKWGNQNERQELILEEYQNVWAHCKQLRRHRILQVFADIWVYAAFQNVLIDVLQMNIWYETSHTTIFDVHNECLELGIAKFISTAYRRTVQCHYKAVSFLQKSS